MSSTKGPELLFCEDLISDPSLATVLANDFHSFPDSIKDADGTECALHKEHLTDSGGLTGCMACGHPELYTRKDFPRLLGFTVVIVAAIFAPMTYYVSLFAAGILDFVLYRFSGDVVECYVCVSQHRRFTKEPRHPSFDREIDERLKFGDKAVMGKPMRPGGTAGAPEPEH
ncbi:MAG: hypothetical protein ACI8TQ_003238 [Planctomycetota bacterium]